MYIKVTVKCLDYDIKTLRFEERTYGRKMAFRNAVGTTYIQDPWLKRTRFVVPDDKFCKEVKERACIRLPIPAGSEFVGYLSKLDDFLDSKEFRDKYGLSSKQECTSKFTGKEMIKIKVPIGDNGGVMCKMFEIMWKPSGRPDRRQLTDIYIGTLNKHLSNSMVRVIASPVRLWSNSTGYGIQFEVARLEFEHAPNHDDKELDRFDDDEDACSVVNDACSVVNDACSVVSGEDDLA